MSSHGVRSTAGLGTQEPPEAGRSPSPSPHVYKHPKPLLAPRPYPGNSTSSFFAPSCFAATSREHRAEVRRQREVAPLVQLLGLEARPLAVHLAALHAAADHEQRAGVAVVRARRCRSAAPCGRTRDIVRITTSSMRSPRSVTSAAIDAREVVEPVRELPRRAALVHVRVPSADVRERDLQPDVRLDELRDLLQPLAELRRADTRRRSAAGTAAGSPRAASSPPRTSRRRPRAPRRRCPVRYSASSRSAACPLARTVNSSRSSSRPSALRPFEDARRLLRHRRRRGTASLRGAVARSRPRTFPRTAR